MWKLPGVPAEQASHNLQSFLEADCKLLRAALKGNTWWKVVLKLYRASESPKELVLVVNTWALITDILVQMFGVGPLVCIAVRCASFGELSFENLCLENHSDCFGSDVGQWLKWR